VENGSAVIFLFPERGDLAIFPPNLPLVSGLMKREMSPADALAGSDRGNNFDPNRNFF
jgi:hypothetical protein